MILESDTETQVSEANLELRNLKRRLGIELCRVSPSKGYAVDEAGRAVVPETANLAIERMFVESASIQISFGPMRHPTSLDESLNGVTIRYNHDRPGKAGELLGVIPDISVEAFMEQVRDYGSVIMPRSAKSKLGNLVPV